MQASGPFVPSLFSYVLMGDCWIGVWLGMTGGMAEYWIVARMGDKELPRAYH